MIKHRTIKEIEQKRCPKCQKWKPLNLFNKHPSHSDGVQSHCRKCNIGKRNKRYQKMKDLCFEHYGGYVCVHCGITDEDVLTLDHINDDGVRMTKLAGLRRRHGGQAYYHWLVRNNFPPEHKLQVLCANCQLIKEKKRRRGNVKERMKNL